jgi:predicted lipoprotein with Yx(FWY)xxD motif
MKRALTLVALLAALLLVACGDDDEGDSAPADTGAEASEPAAEEPAAGKAEKPEKPAKSGTEITIGQSQFGEIVFDGNNQAIYLFDKETTSESQCYGECAAAWPPVLTKGEPVATGKADQKLLGTTKRDDGTTQVTYKGQPLYYYAHEEPGQVLCHNVDEFGGLWLVLDANGDALS